MSKNIKEAIYGFLCGTGSCLFIVGMLPQKLLSTIIGVLIASWGIYYVMKHRPAKWFLITFIVCCACFILLLPR